MDINNEKIIDTSTLKSKQYINYEPKPQSEGDKFVIKLLKDGEIQVLSNNKIFYPK